MKRGKRFIIMMAILVIGFGILLKYDSSMNQIVEAQESYPAWNPSTIYNTGDMVTYDGKVWMAQWYTQGQVPGSAEAYGVWKLQTSQTPGTYPTWNAFTVYNTGDIVSYGGRLWIAQWWTQGQTPGTTGEYGVWREYTESGPVTDTQAPTVPTNLVSTSKTSTSITISWTASTDNVAVTAYEIYSNNTLLGTSSTTSYTARGLSPNTTYSFTVRAVDAAGNKSMASTQLLVTTDGESGGGNGGDETVKYYSNLPVIYIDTENGQAITSKEVYVKAKAKIMGIGSELNTALYDGDIKIRGRGNSTWFAPKKPYRIKLDKKTDLFGMGNNKDYVLLANYYDLSLMRNMIAFDFAKKLGFDVTEFQSVDLVLNGVYEGNYLLCEQTEIAKDRVDIFDWEDAAEDIAKAAAKSIPSLQNMADELEDALVENLTWATSGSFTFQGVTIKISDYYDLPNITGGYLLELDDTYDEISQFKTKSGQPIMIKSPEYAKTNQEMFNYIQSYVQAFEDAVRSNDFHATFNGQRVHYSDLFDMDSLVDFWIITEVFGNLDSMFKSTYMYKDVDGLMKMGPLWDWDLCAGGSMVIEFRDYTQTWQTLYRQLSPAQGQQWYRYLIKDPEFLQKAYDRYHSIRNTLIEDLIRNGGVIDQFAAYLAQSGQLNLEKWPSNNMWWPMPNPQVPKYEDKVAEVKNWMNNHITWLDQQFTSFARLRSSLGVN